MKYLLDTNILSEIRKRHYDPNVFKWIRSVPATQLCMCVISLGEIRRGIEKRRLSDRNYAEIYENWLAELERQYGERIFVFDKSSADQWGRLIVNNPAHSTDMQIAAIAMVHQCVIVTRNVKHFAGLSVKIINPFEPPHA